MLAAGGANHGEGGTDIIHAIGVAIFAATIMAYISHLLKQPLLLAYMLAGVIIGPIGLKFIKNYNDIEAISHFGLILLLFLIGLEIDIKKLKESGKSLIITGITQFPLTALIGVGFFLLLGYTLDNGKYDLIYLVACCGLSSTAIVVKLLYGKFELSTLGGRISLGILVFQDIWVIILLGIQPNLANPDLLQILFSFLKGILLVLVSLSISKYILPRLFKTIAKVPELILVFSLGWCFFICGVASYFNLSLEMGALIAGIAISTFPYNMDVIAKVINIRDFFVTLFFVSLGMQIPNPFVNPNLLLIALITSVFLILSRFLVIFPLLYNLKNGLRVSLLPAINLSQISEFSLVLVSLGFSANHISRDTLSIVIFVFVITSILSTYFINYNDNIQKILSKILKKIGLNDVSPGEKMQDSFKYSNEIILLGFYQVASSFIYEIVSNKDANHLKNKVTVIDFNPDVYKNLRSLGINALYGDISHADTLHHAGIEKAKIVISTIPDTLLLGTNNLKIIKIIKGICPQAKIITTSENIKDSLMMYNHGASYVYMSRILSAQNLVNVIYSFLGSDHDDFSNKIKKEISLLESRKEVIR